jgi:photosystem II stability/assembly factor-like uncharacterized protein
VNVTWGTITTIAAAPSNSQWIYAGTDDGNVWRTSNGGTNWTKISEDLPLRWVTRVAVDPVTESTVYVTLSGYRYDSYLPHVFRSTDGGDTWQDITGDLPEAPVNDIIVDPLVDSALYVGTDFGVFVSWNLGINWHMLGDNLPNVPIVDLRLHEPTHTLVAATYGRSMYSFNLDQLVAVHELDNLPEVTLAFPNPYISSHPILLNGVEGKEYSVTASDLNGHVIYSNRVGSGHTFRLDSGIASGLYVISVSEEGKVIGAWKVMIIR